MCMLYVYVMLYYHYSRKGPAFPLKYGLPYVAAYLTSIPVITTPGFPIGITVINNYL